MVRAVLADSHSLGVTRACQNPPGLWGPGSPLPTFPCSVRFRC